MAYTRKTRDTYELQGNYGHGDGWECLTAEDSRAEIRQRLKEYRENEGGNYRIVKKRERIDPIKDRLEYLRGELRAERISYGEIAELQSLAEHIEPGDVELLEAAGVPEFPESETEAPCGN
jgi:hypothetical protein